MRLELVILAVLTLSLVGLVASTPRLTSDGVVLSSCKDLVLASEVHGAEVYLPCPMEEGKIYYGDEEADLPSTSYGVVVGGKHWPSP